MVVFLPRVVQENLRFAYRQTNGSTGRLVRLRFLSSARLTDRHHHLAVWRAGGRLREEPSSEMMDTQQVRQSLLKDSAVVDAIRRRAHQLSLERGYSTPQHMAEDWFRAEKEVLDRLVEEEIKRRQKMNAAISEGAMAEEAIPAVVLPPSLAEALHAPRSGVKKSSTRRKKAAATTEAAAPETGTPDASATRVSSTAASPAAEAVSPSLPKRKRKSSAGVTAADQDLPPITPDPAPAAPASKPKSATSAKSKASKKKSA